ncbi:sulfotransferase domain-containing protein [Pseudomonadales bacterium]|nr:sulfotransferase domain-containing protein [Pseudomonadales bacterium]
MKNSTLDRFRFTVSKYFSGCGSDDLLILSTITKTGTHYLRFLFTYYTKCLDNGVQATTLEPLEIDRYFPNNYHNHYLFPKIVKKRPKMKTGLSLKDIPRSHIKYQDSWNKTRVLHTYRNPINYATVYFLYKVKSDPRFKLKFDTPFQVFMMNYETFAEEYYSHLVVSMRANVYRLNFDTFIKNPVSEFKEVLTWMGLIPDLKIIENASRFINEHFPDAAVGASEAWMRNGKAKDCEDRESFQRTFLNSNEINSAFLWSKVDLESAQRLINSDVRLEEFHR